MTNKTELTGISGTLFWTLVLQQLASASPAMAHGHHAGGNGRHGGAITGGDNLNRGGGRHQGHNNFVSHFALQMNELPMDLSSAERSVTLTGDLLKHGNSVTILVGGAQTTFGVGDKLTAAELVAVQQEQSGRQTLQIDDRGKAQSGSFSLNNLTSNKSSIDVSNIVIPQGVQAIDLVSSRNHVEISGDLTNFGSIYEISRGRQSGSASIAASSIVNESGGLITSISRGGGPVDLRLDAANDFVNKGAITSSGSLDISAGGTFKNAGESTRASIYANRDINIRSANVNNHGDITSASGAVTLSSAPGQNLTVNNAGGVISATSGDINIREAAYNGSDYSSVTGGDLLSQTLNLNSGQGLIDVNVEQLTGEVVSTGSAVHVTASTDTLIIGTQCLSGDPTYYNSAGGIVINGNISVGEALAIIARDSITATAALTSIDTHNGGANQGFDISLIAGVNVSGPGVDTTGVPTPGNTATGNVSFTGASANGGDVNLTGAGALTIDSRSMTGAFAGGNITLAAYQGAGGGNVNLNNNSVLNATGSGAGANGDVTIVAPNTVSIGSITGAGKVSIVTSQPVFSSGSTMTFDTQGNVTTGNTIQGDVTSLGIGTVTIPGTVNADTMSINAGSNAQINNVSVIKNLSITAVNNININGNVTAPQGILMVAGHNITTSGAGTSLLTEGATQIGGKAGDVTMVAGASFTVDPLFGTVTVLGGSLTGGQMQLTNISQLRANASVANSAGGDITLVSFLGSDATGGVSYSGALQSQANSSLQPSGDITVVAGGTNSPSISLGNINTSGGANGTGNVSLSASTPATPVTIDSTGLITSGDFLNGTRKAGGISTGSITSPGTVFITKAGQYDLLGAVTSGAFVIEADFITVQANVLSTNSVSLLSTGDIQLDSDLRAAGGIALVAGGDIRTQSAGVDLDTTTPTADSGSMTIIAGASYSRTNTTVSVDGASVSGGNIDFSSTPINSIATDNLNGFNAGSVTMVAFANGAKGTITANGSLNGIRMGGGGVATGNGSLTVVAGKATGTVINLPDIDGTTGNFGNIEISTTTPTVSAGSPLAVSVGPFAGTIVGGDPVDGTGALHAADIVVGNITQRRATVNINSGRNVVIGDISTVGFTGNGGDVTINTVGTAPLQIGNTGTNSVLSINTSALSFGKAGGIFITEAGNQGISLVLPSAITQTSTNGPGARLTLDAGTGTLSLPSNNLAVVGGIGQGGILSLTASDITWTNQGTFALFLDASGTPGSAGGIIQVSLSGSSPVTIGNNAGQLKFNVSGGGSVDFAAPNADLTVDSTAITLNPVTDGGSLTLTSATIANINGANPLILDVSGTGAGKGGTLMLTTTQATTPLVIGTLAGQTELRATSGGGAGDGGQVIVQAAGDVTVADTVAINVNPLTNGKGGSIVLQAGGVGTGNLLILGSLSAAGAGGPGGSISLSSNSSVPFAIGGKKLVNGISGTVTVTGTSNGAFAVNNLGGGITQAATIAAVSNVTYNAVGPITISKALGDATTNTALLTTSGSGDITASKPITSNIVVVSSAGAIGGKKGLSVNASNVQANGINQVVVTDTRTTPVQLNASSSGTSNFTFTSAGDITTNGVISGQDITIASAAKTGSIVLSDAVLGIGTVTLTATGSGTITHSGAVGQILGTDLILQSKTGGFGTLGNPIRENVASLTVLSSGDAFFNDLGPGPLTVGAVSTAGNFNLFSAGPVTFTSALKSARAIDITSFTDNDITFNASMGGKSTDTISLNAGGAGDIVQGNAKAALIANSAIVLGSTSGDITAHLVSAPTLALTTFAIGVVDVVSNFKGTVTLNNSNSGNLFSLATAGGMTVGNVFGNTVNLTANSGAITFAGGTITASAGIVVNNKSTKGIIEFQAGTTMTTNIGTPGLGEIDIVVGTLPPPTVVGTTPANVNATGQVFFNNGLTASAPTNNVSGINTNLIFSAPTAAQILLDGGVTITADPPLPAPVTTAAIGSTIPNPRLDSQAIIAPIVTSNTSAAESHPAILFPQMVDTSISSPVTALDALGVKGFDNLNLIGLKPTNDASFGSRTVSNKIWISETEIEGGRIPASVLLDNGTASGSTAAASQWLSSGTILAASAKDSSIATPFGTVSIGAKTVALVMAFRNGIAIFDLHDDKHDAVVFTSGDKKVSLKPGQAVLIAKQSSQSFEDLNPAQLVGYRQITEHEFNDELKLFNAEFSLPTAMNACPQIKTLMQSKDPHTAHMAKSLLKTTAVLMHLKSGGANFQQKLRPQVTAYSR